MDLHIDPETLAPDNRPVRIVDTGEAIRWVIEGRTDSWLCQEYERRHNILTAPGMWGALRRRVGRARARHLAVLVPWAISAEHRWAHPLTMLRIEAGRRAGAELVEWDARRLGNWLANLREGDLVIDYHPRTDEGFAHVPRRPGIDRDLVRDPRR